MEEAAGEGVSTVNDTGENGETKSKQIYVSQMRKAWRIRLSERTGMVIWRTNAGERRNRREESGQIWRSAVWQRNRAKALSAYLSLQGVVSPLLPFVSGHAGNSLG